MKTRKEIKQQAAAAFSAHYWPAVGTLFLVTLISGLASYAANGLDSIFDSFAVSSLNIVFAPSVVTGLAVVFLTAPLVVGTNMYCLRLFRGEGSSLAELFEEGFSDYGHVVGGYLYMLLFIFLWSLLFIIPGIIKSFSYAMTPYLLADCKAVSATDALKLSNRMMEGHKWELFVFHLSFLGWHLLNGLTLGLLGIFYVMPYYRIACAGYYEERKRQALAEGVITEEELMGAPIV